jgi:pentatricopeptide repeat domain-containing protein 1
MKEENLVMNDISIGCLIDACVKCYNIEKAYEIIKSENITNTVVYTTLLKGFSKTGDF